ncbi:phosphomannomutase [Aeromonas salmonicida]|uniref:phosphomannomutase n=1 Tax=Aeromonas salmonicida TaxID=645 RepID=UPI000C1C2A8A|nr:phosphomannomutase [Aeromonas salmonicida]ATU98473.1 phosphomannomutase [Aeromonas salmonicida]HEG4446353.1 phosphomannomutase [Aeromonas hydrophila]
MTAGFNCSAVIAGSCIAFGTSGARGLVVDFTPEVCAAFAHAFIYVMRGEYEVKQIALAIDNRPSSPVMARACAAAMLQAGVEPIYYGVVPTPALAYKAMQDKMPCIMVTGSHIPFDRNGLKFYRPDGEITKADEAAILSSNVEFATLAELPELQVRPEAAQAYCLRYSSLFASDLLRGKRIGIYEHSSAGRELYAPLLRQLGAEVIALERSDSFVPIDTEAVGEEDKTKARRWSAEYQLDAIFSTDGDGDRPLVADEKGEWLRGDILGLLCASALDIEALAIPVSSNTVIARCGRFNCVQMTKIGSPYVIAEFVQLAKQYQRVAGFEANGGFLLGSDIDLNGQSLAALPTRDAVLPFLMLLAAAGKGPISPLVAALPARYTHSDRIQNFATARSQGILTEGIADPQVLLAKLGLIDCAVSLVDTTDGLRLTLNNGFIIHLRPSGNAPELRCYAEADKFEIARMLVSLILTNLINL